jgi:ankyrin repeat protein
MYASLKNNINIAKILLANGAEIDTKGAFGYTALIIASFNNNTKLIELLMKYNPNKQIVDDNGKSYYYYLNSENKKIFNK